MALTGSINGTDVQLAVESAPASGTFNAIGGLVTNSFTLNNGAIDITNKSSASFREVMAGEGLQTLDMSAEVIFSTDANFALVKSSALAKTVLAYQVARGSEVLAVNLFITSFAETSPDNDKQSASISFISDGAITGV
jgi:predicted secreted protein